MIQSEKLENILIVNGAENDYNTKMIKQGYDKVLKPLVSDGKVNIISEEWSANWLREYAFNVVDSKLQQGEKLMLS